MSHYCNGSGFGDFSYLSRTRHLISGVPVSIHFAMTDVSNLVGFWNDLFFPPNVQNRYGLAGVSNDSTSPTGDLSSKPIDTSRKDGDLCPITFEVEINCIKLQNKTDFCGITFMIHIFWFCDELLLFKCSWSHRKGRKHPMNWQRTQT